MPASDNLVFGLELEFGNPDRYLYDKFYLAKRNHEERTTINGKSRWLNLELGTDTSASKGRYANLHGYEFRTDTPWKEFPKDEVKFVLNYIQVYYGRINEFCGLHFHWSGIPMTLKQEAEMEKRLKKVQWWNSRHEWVGVYVEKYRPLNVVDRGCWHYEARVFNASSNYQGILRPWLFLRKNILDVTGNK